MTLSNLFDILASKVEASKTDGRQEGRREQIKKNLAIPCIASKQKKRDPNLDNQIKKAGCCDRTAKTRALNRKKLFLRFSAKTDGQKTVTKISHYRKAKERAFSAEQARKKKRLPCREGHKKHFSKIIEKRVKNDVFKGKH